MSADTTETETNRSEHVVTYRAIDHGAPVVGSLTVSVCYDLPPEDAVFWVCQDIGCDVEDVQILDIQRGDRGDATGGIILEGDR